MLTTVPQTRAQMHYLCVIKYTFDYLVNTELVQHPLYTRVVFENVLKSLYQIFSISKLHIFPENSGKLQVWAEQLNLRLIPPQRGYLCLQPRDQ